MIFACNYFNRLKIQFRDNFRTKSLQNFENKKLNFSQETPKKNGEKFSENPNHVYENE